MNDMKDEEIIVTGGRVAEETVSEEKSTDITVTVVSSWDVEEIFALYRIEGWWEETRNPEKIISAIFSGSFAVAVAFNAKNRAVGMGRVLSDGVSDAYIQDVVVDPACRGEGIGKRIIHVLVRVCLDAGISWIALVAEPGTHTFYEPLGFSVMEDYTPMKYAGIVNDNGDMNVNGDMNNTGDTP